METSYEWCVETLDQFGDIQDNEFSKKLGDLDIDQMNTKTERRELCLVKYIGDNDVGEKHRAYWYPATAKNREFDDGSDVPKKFITEVINNIT